ncbi:MAG: hypothetical protein JSS34_01325 [Proteobacteria bacterium]|nr:hypothetical protein [Pseudomonadota bacterium]
MKHLKIFLLNLIITANVWGVMKEAPRLSDNEQRDFNSVVSRYPEVRAGLVKRKIPRIDGYEEPFSVEKYLSGQISYFGPLAFEQDYISVWRSYHPVKQEGASDNCIAQNAYLAKAFAVMRLADILSKDNYFPEWDGLSAYRENVRKGLYDIISHNGMPHGFFASQNPEWITPEDRALEKYIRHAWYYIGVISADIFNKGFYLPHEEKPFSYAWECFEKAEEMLKRMPSQKRKYLMFKARLILLGYTPEGMTRQKALELAKTYADKYDRKKTRVNSSVEEEAEEEDSEITPEEMEPQEELEEHVSEGNEPEENEEEDVIPPPSAFIRELGYDEKLANSENPYESGSFEVMAKEVREELNRLFPNEAISTPARPRAQRDSRSRAPNLSRLGAHARIQEEGRPSRHAELDMPSYRMDASSDQHNPYAAVRDSRTRTSQTERSAPPRRPDSGRDLTHRRADSARDLTLKRTSHDVMASASSAWDQRSFDDRSQSMLSDAHAFGPQEAGKSQFFETREASSERHENERDRAFFQQKDNPAQVFETPSKSLRDPRERSTQARFQLESYERSKPSSHIQQEPFSKTETWSSHASHLIQRALRSSVRPVTPEPLYFGQKNEQKMQRPSVLSPQLPKRGKDLHDLEALNPSVFQERSDASAIQKASDQRQSLENPSFVKTFINQEIPVFATASSSLLKSGTPLPVSEQSIATTMEVFPNEDNQGAATEETFANEDDFGSQKHLSAAQIEKEDSGDDAFDEMLLKNEKGRKKRVIESDSESEANKDQESSDLDDLFEDEAPTKKVPYLERGSKFPTIRKINAYITKQHIQFEKDQFESVKHVLEFFRNRGVLTQEEVNESSIPATSPYKAVWSYFKKTGALKLVVQRSHDQTFVISQDVKDYLKSSKKKWKAKEACLEAIRLKLVPGEIGNNTEYTRKMKGFLRANNLNEVSQRKKTKQVISAEVKTFIAAQGPLTIVDAFEKLCTKKLVPEENLASNEAKQYYKSKLAGFMENKDLLVTGTFSSKVTEGVKSFFKKDGRKWAPLYACKQLIREKLISPELGENPKYKKAIRTFLAKNDLLAPYEVEETITDEIKRILDTWELPKTTNEAFDDLMKKGLVSKEALASAESRETFKNRIRSAMKRRNIWKQSF